MSASRRRVTGITLPCAASFKNSSGVGEYMKSFLAEARRKQKQEAVENFPTSSRNQLPFRFQTLPLNPFVQSCAIQLFARHGEHGANIAQMFFRTAFAKIF